MIIKSDLKTEVMINISYLLLYISVFLFGYSNESESDDLPLEVDQWIPNPDSDSSHITSKSVDLKNLDSTDYG